MPYPVTGNYAIEVPARNGLYVPAHRPKIRLDALGIIHKFTVRKDARYIYR
jgi:hypothetical protein